MSFILSSLVSESNDDVSISAQPLNTRIMFIAGQSLSESFTVNLNDDSVALENNETFKFWFSTSSFTSDQVKLGSNGFLNIVDDDSKG